MKKDEIIRRLDAGEAVSDAEWAFLMRTGKKGKLPTAERTGSTQFTLRLPTTLLDQITEAAHARGSSTGELMRELMETSLALGFDVSPALIARVLARLLESPDLARAAKGKAPTN